MVDIQQTHNLHQSLAPHASKASLSTGADRKEHDVLDSQFDAALEELNKESLSELDNVQAEELIEETNNSEIAHLAGEFETNDEESFRLNYGINGREDSDQQHQDQDQQNDPEDETYQEAVPTADHDTFELAVHAGGEHDDALDEKVDSKLVTTGQIALTDQDQLSEETSVFDLVPQKPTDQALPGEESWASEFSLEEIFQDTLGENEEDLIDIETSDEQSIEDLKEPLVSNENQDQPKENEGQPFGEASRSPDNTA